MFWKPVQLALFRTRNVSKIFALEKVLCAIFRRIFTSFQVWWSGPKVWHIKSQMWGEGVKTLSLRRRSPKIVFIGSWSTLSPLLVAIMIIMIILFINSTRERRQAPPYHLHHHNHHLVHDHQQNDGQQDSSLYIHWTDLKLPCHSLMMLRDFAFIVIFAVYSLSKSIQSKLQFFWTQFNMCTRLRTVTISKCQESYLYLLSMYTLNNSSPHYQNNL